MEKNINNHLMIKMSEYNSGDTKRIQHLMKVYTLCKLIGETEGLDDECQAVLEIAAIMHDIGVKPSEKKYGNCYGPNQEKEGVTAAEEMFLELEKEGFTIKEKYKDRVKYLIGHHHTYNEIDGPDYQILLEADFLVNMYEMSIDEENVKNTLDKLFVTETSIRLLNAMMGW